MPLDHISEVVAHFIGCFNLDEEGPRLRDPDEAVNWRPEEYPELNPFGLADPISLPGFKLAGYDPGLTPFWFSYMTPDLSMPAVRAIATDGGTAPWWRDSDRPPGDTMGLSGTSGTVRFEIPTAPSQLTVSFQLNVMADNDSLGVHDLYAFKPVSDFEHPMSDLVAQARAISADFPTSLNDVIAAPVPIFSDAVNSDESDSSDVVSAEFQGEASYQTVVNGEVVTELPVLSELFPDYFQADDTEETSYFDAEAGHNTVSGGNFLINETIIVQAAPDAGLILVAGDVISLNATSQTNVLQNNDIGTDPEGLVDLAVNAAQMVQTVTSVEETDDAPAMPSNWAVTRIDGDLINTNWVQQHNFITDHDTATITWSASDSFILTGGNTGLNQVISVNIAMNYDLIVIGGQMIDMNLIHQMNVLLDDDTLCADTDLPFTASGGDNLLCNLATIQQQGSDSFQNLTAEYADVIEGLGGGSDVFPTGADLSAAGDGMLSVLYISGDYINVNSVEQINTLGDADQVGVAFDGMSEYALETDGDITFTLGSNALVNVATIIDDGIDSTVMAGGDIYDDAMLYQAELIENDAGSSAPLASEAVVFLMDETHSVPNELPLIGPDHPDECPSDITQCMIA